MDEAESSINALTILTKGVPADTFLGEPIFENTLTIPWPESEEYEFRDSSYSNGVAVYHGWLPLYAIAASFRLFGVQPPRPGATAPQYSADERRFRTRIARLPSVLFGLASLIGLYLAGSRLHSRQVGLLAMTMATFLALHISYSQQARYYSATLACAAFSCWSVACVVQQHRWRDFLWAAICFSALFYTHILAFAIMAPLFGLAVCCSPARRDRANVPKVAAFAGLVGGACVPWLLSTHFLENSNHIPKTWLLMRLPQDLVMERILESQYGAILAIGFVLLVVDVIGSKSLRISAMRGFSARRRSWILLYAWLIAGYFGFLFLIPAASFALGRLVLMLIVPTILLISMLFNTLAIYASQKYGFGLATAAVTVFVAVSNYMQPSPFESDRRRALEDIDEVVKYLNGVTVRADTKLFATPNEHLLLTFYTGLPVQSIAPVRKQFLDFYPGEIIFFEKVNFVPTDAITPTRLQAEAAAHEQALDDRSAKALSWQLASLEYRREIAPHVLRVTPPISPGPMFASACFREHVTARRRLEARSNELVHQMSPIFGDMFIGTISDWWNGFFYRFSDPLRRKQNPNYRDRMMNGEATILPSADWAVFRSRGGLPLGSRPSRAAKPALRYIDTRFPLLTGQ